MNLNRAKTTINQLFFLLLSVFVLSGCGGSSGSNEVTTTPTIGAKLTVSFTDDQGASVSSAQATSAILINVKATNDFGKGVSGITITFATDLGSVSQATALTDNTGIASVRLITTDTQLGVAAISAAATVDSKELTKSGQISITEPTVVVTNLNLSLFDEDCNNPVNTVEAGKTLCLKASLFQGTTPVANEIIDFASTLGTLRPSSALTDSSGIATAYIDSTTDIAGAATVTATNENLTPQSINFQYTPHVPVPADNPVVNFEILDSNCVNPATTSEAGNTLCLKATLTQFDSPLSQQIITFAAPIGALRQATSLTDSSGVAITFLDSSQTTTGASTASASFGQFSSSLNYQFIPLTITTANLSLTLLDANCINSLNDVTAGASLCLQASLYLNNQPVTNAIVNFSAPLGTLRQATALTNASGVASVILQSTPTTLGAAIASASYNSVSANHNYQFSQSPSQSLTDLQLLVRDSQCAALTNDGAAGTSLCLAVQLSENNLPLSNKLITFAAPIGTLEQTTALTNDDGFTEVLLTSAITDLGAATATASYGDFVRSANYEFTKGNVDQQTDLSLNIFDQNCSTEVSSSNAGTPLCIKAQLSNSTGGIADKIIEFAATLGSLVPTSALTDAEGNVTVMLQSTVDQIGAATITATHQALSTSKNYQLVAQSASRNLSLASYKEDCSTVDDSYIAGSTFCLAATLLDDTGPIENEIIDFTTPLGTLTQVTALTNESGVATVLVTSTATELGAAAATATNTNLSAVANYELLSDDSAPQQGPQLTLIALQNGIEKNSFKASEKLQLQATLTDSDQQPTKNVIIRYTVERGQLATDSALTGDQGKAEVTLSATEADIGAAVATAQAVIDGVTYTQSFNYEVLTPDAVELDEARIGYYDGDTFVNGQIGTTIAVDDEGNINLSAGGTMGLSVVVIDKNGKRIISPTPVTFSSACAANSNANLDEQTTTINGEAHSTYEDISCATTSGNQDTLVATITVNNTALTATRTIFLQPDVIGSIEFISAVPSAIVLRGTGGQGKQETSTLTFSIKSLLGNPVTQQAVTFSLDTGVGDLSINPVTSFTNSQGLVTTKVTAGFVPAAVRVTASTVVEGSTTITTQSDLLSVNTGLPDQNSITIATAELNPEANSFTGREVVLTAYMADTFNNPVPDGTTINFTTEGGFIQPTCNTVNGSCNVTWTGTNPRVANHRITILATAIGHETFFDVNGNNVFDDADTPNGSSDALNQGTDSGLGRGDYASAGFVDHSEAWRDDDEDRSHDDGEAFIDYNNDKTFNAADGLFNGPHCTHTSMCGTDSTRKINVRKALVMIMSGSSVNFTLSTSQLSPDNNNHLDYLGTQHVLSSNDSENAVVIDGGVTVNGSGTATNTSGIIELDEGHSLQMTLSIADNAQGLGQILPAGTTVAITTSFGSVTGTTSATIPNSVGYVNSTGNDQYGGNQVSFSLVNTNSTTDVGDTTQSGLMTFTFVMPSSNRESSFSMPFTMIGR